MPDYFRRTARLGFRTWKDGDLDLALGLWGDPAVARFIDAKGRLSVGEVTRRLAEEIRCDAEHGVQYKSGICLVFWAVRTCAWSRGVPAPERR